MAKEKIKDSFGSYLKDLRSARDLTIREVADKTIKLFPDNKHAQVSHSYLTYLEKDKFIPPPSKIKALALAYSENYEFMLYKAGYLDRNPFKPMEELDANVLWDYCFQSLVSTKKTRPLTEEEKKSLKQMLENMIVTMTGGRSV